MLPLTFLLNGCNQSVPFSLRRHSHTEEFWWDKIGNEHQHRIRHLPAAGRCVLTVRVHVSSFIFVINLFWWNDRERWILLSLNTLEWLFMCIGNVFFFFKGKNFNKSFRSSALEMNLECHFQSWQTISSQMNDLVKND